MRKGLARFVHPMVLIEWHQSVRQIWLPVSLLILASLGLRFWMGTFGIFLGIFILIPIVGVSLGIGSFQEEVAKGQLRYLYGMPIRWSTVWWVKQVSAIVTLLLLTIMICAILLIGNDLSLGPLEGVAPKAVIMLMFTALVGVMLLYTLIIYIMSFFTIMACKSAKVAQAIASIMIHLPGLSLFLVCLKFGVIPHVLAVAAMLFSGTLVLAVGSYVLFAMRNPLVERPWRLRGAAVCFILLAGLSFVGAGLIANALGARFQPLPRQLSNYSVGQEQRKIALTLSDGLKHYTMITDRDGKVLNDLGEGLSLVNRLGINWRPGNNQILCEDWSFFQDFRGMTSDDPWVMDWFLVDTATGDRTDLNIDLRDDNDFPLIPNQWSSDGKRMIGSHSTYGPIASDSESMEDESDGAMLYAVIYDIEEGTAERTPMHEPGIEGVYNESLSGDYFVMSRSPGGYGGMGMSGYGMDMGGDAEDDEVDKSIWIERVHLQDDTRVRITLPTDTEAWDIDKANEHILVVVKELDDEGIGYRVLLYSFQDPQADPAVLMGRDELPRMSLREAARKNQNYMNEVSASFVGDGRWAAIYVTKEGEADTPAVAVIDILSGEQVQQFLGLFTEYSNPTVSPGHTCLMSMKIEGGYLSIKDYSSPMQEPTEPETTTFSFHELFSETQKQPVEVTIPGWTTQSDWLDDTTVVCMLRQGNGFGLWNSSGMVLVRIDVTTGDLYRLYPDPGPIEPADLQREPIPWVYKALISSMNAGP